MYKRAEYQLIKDRMKEPRRFIQVVMGARQIGKSTVVKQVLKDVDMPYQFFSADKYNNALKMVYSPLTFEQAILNRKSWGHIFESGIGVYLVPEVRQHVGGYQSYDAGRGLVAYTSFEFPYLALYEKREGSFHLLWDIKPPASTYEIRGGEIVADRKQKGGSGIAITKDYIVVLHRDYETDQTDESTVGRDVSKCPHTVFLFGFDSHLVKIVDLGMPVMRIAALPDSNRLYAIGAYPDYVLAEYDL